MTNALQNLSKQVKPEVIQQINKHGQRINNPNNLYHTVRTFMSSLTIINSRQLKRAVTWYKKADLQLLRQ